MKFPSYWSKATATEVDCGGKQVAASCWRWSDTSKEDAHRSALAAAHQVLQRIMRGDHLGDYSYGQRRFREEVIESQTDLQGNLVIAVTRNSYGVLVLNTANVMFIDVDLSPITIRARLRYFFSQLFGGKGPSPEKQQITKTMSRLDEFLSRNLDWGVRLYRTSAGLRMLVTHALFDPCADSTQVQLDAVGADPLYTRLCRNQECFRARLTPKPWRCGHTPNRIAWPQETDEDRRCLEAWLAEYERRQSGYATCRFVGTLGNQSIHSEIEPVIEMHDDFTRAHQDLPLA